MTAEPGDVERTDRMGETTQVFVWVRRKVTAKVLWGAVLGLVSALVAVITVLVTTQAHINKLEEHDAARERTVAEMHAQLESLHNIESTLEGISHDIANIKGELARQQDEWDYVHGVANAPPHANRRRQ